MELWQHGANELARLIQAKKTSSREVVESHLQRIEQINPKINAITVVLGESALEAADNADRQIAKGNVSPLSGVPMSIKENQDVAGSATTLGLEPLKNAIAKHDSPHIAALRHAGAIPIARTNMPEFGMRWHTTNGIYGPTLNPHNIDLTPGGSSGGEAAAIASGMSPLGIGNDGAGSLRWPAQCCGISALKPSHGRVPIANTADAASPIPFAFQLLGVHGPMARHIEDLELAFKVMCSTTSSDPWHIQAPFLGEPLDTPLRVGVVSNVAMSPGVAQALDASARMLAGAGYIVEPVDLPSLERASEIYTQIMDRFGRLTAEPQRLPVGVISQEYDDFWAAFNNPWAAATGEETHDPLMERGAIFHEWYQLMERTPLILAPIATLPAWQVGSDLHQAWLTNWLEALRTVVAVNLLGLPAVALPTVLHDNMPQGVQVIGQRFREDLCLAAAKDIETQAGTFPPPCWSSTVIHKEI